jgi:hypothetical protein
MHHAHWPDSTEKSLQEHPRTCRASGARPAGPLTRPHGKALATRREGRPISRLQHLREPGRHTRRCSGATVGDSPWGPLKQPGESCLKPAKNQRQGTSHLNTRPRHGPHQGGPHGPAEWPSQCLSRAGSASLEGLHLPRAGSASLEGSRLPRAGSASLEDPSLPRSRRSLHARPPPHARTGI